MRQTPFIKGDIVETIKSNSRHGKGESFRIDNTFGIAPTMTPTSTTRYRGISILDGKAINLNHGDIQKVVGNIGLIRIAKSKHEHLQKQADEAKKLVEFYTTYKDKADYYACELLKIAKSKSGSREKMRKFIKENIKTSDGIQL